jgi:glycerate 2-kinase
MSKIQNFDQLATTPERRTLLSIAEAGLAAIDTKKVIRELAGIDGNFVTIGNEKIDLNQTGKLIFIGVGKCAADAAAAVEEVLGDRITRGVAVDVKQGPELNRIKTFCGTHPLPSDQNLAAAEAIVECLQGLTDRDAVIFAISGGGSTLLFLPEDKNDREEIKIFNALTKAGATIQEMNVVRKHLSLARGGFLAQAAYPARIASLIFSDVPGDEISSIASGPTVKDETTIEDAEKILAKYGISRAPGLVETPKEEKYFANTVNILAVSNRRALEAMKKTAEESGFSAEIRDIKFSGEASEVAKMVAEAIHAAPPKSALLWGGETTVTVRGSGQGGRNLTVSATALDYVREGEEILSLASDGHDHGPFAGAICDTITKDAVEKAGLDRRKFLGENDTYPFFEKIGNYLVTGDTGSNVSDLIIALKK